MLKPFLALTLLNSALYAEVAKESAKSGSVLPALKVLPAGSVLSGVRIPRYNADYTPASMLTAKQLKIISKQQIRGSSVGLTLYDNTGAITAKTHLNTIDYNQRSELIKTSENLKFSSPQFKSTSQGLILDWKNRRGFLLGKNHTIIYLKKSVSMKDKSTTNNIISQKAISAMSAVAAASIVTAPKVLTADELAEFDRLSQPSTEQIQELNEKVNSEVANAERISEITNQRKAELLVAIEAAQQDVKDTPEQKAPVQPLEELKPEKGKDHFSIKSDGNIFFDAIKGIMVFNKNVRLTHPQYTFSCAGEVKVILAKKIQQKKLTPEELAKLKPNEKFGDISQIIATDNITLTGADKDNNPITARAGNLIYDHKTGAIILRGLNSRITLPDKQIKIVRKDGHIRIDRNWHVTAKGSQIDLNIEKLKKKGN